MKFFTLDRVTTRFSSQEISILLKLTIPLMLTGFIESLSGFFTTLFVAQLGVSELAASAVVTRTFITLMVIIWGILSSVSVLVAQQQGEKNDDAISQTLRDGLILAFILTVPVMLLLWNIFPILKLTGLDPVTIQFAEACIRGLVWGVLPDFVSLVLMQFLIGLGHTRISMFFTLLWVPLNIFLTYVLMFGKFSFPMMGVAGIGWGLTLAYWILNTALLVYLIMHKNYRSYFKHMLHMGVPDFLKELWKIGLPMGSMYFVELAYFLALTLLMGQFGDNQLAATQIALQYLMVLSMVTFAIAQAVTVRMGHTLGAKEISRAEYACYIGVLLAISFMFLVAICYWFFPTWLISLDLNIHSTKNTAVITYTKHFFAIAAVFQLLEGLRFIMFGALRSLKDMRFSLFSSIISFWLIALPAGYLFSTLFNKQGAGLWWGMVLGAACSALLLTWRFQYKMAQAKKHYYLATLKT